MVKFISRDRNLTLFFKPEVFDSQGKITAPAKFIRFDNGMLTTEDKEVIAYIRNSEPYKSNLITEVPLNFIPETTPKTIKGMATSVKLAGEESPRIEQSKAYRCDYCGEEFGNPNHLRFHLKKHKK